MRNNRAILFAVSLLLGSSLAVRSTESRFSFRTDILPILTHAGCNAGACHGAFVGQGGFRLSLLGYDAEEDHLRITRELLGRRVDLESPDESLILRKASLRTEHEGGRRLLFSSDGYRLLREWISRGAPFGDPQQSVKGLFVEPEVLVLSRESPPSSIRVKARFSDDSEREVTHLASYQSNDEAVAMVDKAGKLRAQGSGVSSIMVRFGGHATAVRILVPFASTPASSSEAAFTHPIDQLMSETMARVRAPLTGLASDGEFLRRVYLDLTGLLPAPLVAQRFLSAPPGREKRQEKIDRLLESEEFNDLWAMRLADQFLVSGKGGGPEAPRMFHAWLRSRIKDRTSFNSLVNQLLTATGKPSDNPPAHFLFLDSDPRDLSEHIGRIFLSSQIACARCHAHPTDRWTQDDYHQFAAYFSRITKDGGSLGDSERGEVDHPKTGKPAEPRPLGEDRQAGEVGRGRRQELAQWLASPANRQFVHSFVNRVWKHLMGRGLVEPVDDLRPSNPASHPALLNALGELCVRDGMDLRKLIRVIVTSEAYQRSSRDSNQVAGVERIHAKGQVKALSAQVFVDMIAQVTGQPDNFPGQPEGTRAVQLATPQVASTALDALGRCRREQSCEGGAGGGGGLAQALHLINGSTINEKLSHGVRGLEAQTPMALRSSIEELYLRTLVRKPLVEELNHWTSLVESADSRVEGLEDLLWTLLNSREFGFNH